jgi:large subunit ribosomal protein L33
MTGHNLVDFEEEAMPRDNIVLQCTDCKSRNYVTTKNKKTTPERLEFQKFCRRCRKHTGHKETK